MRFYFLILLLFVIGCKKNKKEADVIDLNPPKEVTALTVEELDGAVILHWVSPQDLDLKEFEITSQPNGVIFIANKDSDEYRIEGLTNGINFTFFIKCVDLSGNKSVGKSITATPKSGDTAPSSVTELKAKAGDSKITLSWTKPQDADLAGYLLLINPSSQTIDLGAELKGYTVTQLTNGIEYTFSVIAIDESGKESSAVTIKGIPVSQRNIYHGNLILTSQNEINVLEDFSMIEGDVIISGADITDISKLASIDSISGNFDINNNANLVSLSALTLKFVGENLTIQNNSLIPNLSGLNNLNKIGGDLRIVSMPALVNLNGLTNLIQVQGNVFIGIEGWKNPTKTSPNSLLADFCGIKNLFVSNGVSGVVLIENNGANPSVAEIENCQ